MRRVEQDPPQGDALAEFGSESRARQPVALLRAVAAYPAAHAVAPPPAPRAAGAAGARRQSFGAGICVRIRLASPWRLVWR